MSNLDPEDDRTPEEVERDEMLMEACVNFPGVEPELPEPAIGRFASPRDWLGELANRLRGRR